jgi:hypothetical protein
MAAGSAGLAHRFGRTQLAAAGLAAIVLQGFGIAGAALSPVLWVALIGFALAVAHRVKNVLLRTLIHERVPDALRGPVPRLRAPAEPAVPSRKAGDPRLQLICGR